MSLQLW